MSCLLSRNITLSRYIAYCNRVHVYARAFNKSVTLSRCSVPSGAFRSDRIDVLSGGEVTMFMINAEKNRNNARP